MQPASVCAPRLRADCQWPAGTCDLRPLAGLEVGAEHPALDRDAVVRGEELEGRAAVPVPHLVRVEPVPVGALAGPQEVPRGAAPAPLPVGVGVAPRAPEVPAFRVRLEPEELDDAIGVHGRSLLAPPCVS